MQKARERKSTTHKPRGFISQLNEQLFLLASHLDAYTVLLRHIASRSSTR